MAKKRKRRSRRQRARRQPTELRTIHINIRKLREEKKLSQSALACLVGIDETSVSHWERGKASPRGNHQDAVASALGVTVADLFREDLFSEAA